jgi:hypothetical protein
MHFLLAGKRAMMMGTKKNGTSVPSGGGEGNEIELLAPLLRIVNEICH